MKSIKVFLVTVLSFFWTASMYAQITSYPYEYGFETSNQDEWGPLANQSSCSNSDWIAAAQGDNVDNNPSAAYEGTLFGLANLISCQPNSVEKTLIGPQFDLSSLSNPIMLFHYHVLGTVNINIDVSQDNGASWELNFAQLTNLDEAAQPSIWESHLLNLSAYSNSTIRVRFRITSNSTNSALSLDTITVIDDSSNAINGQGDVFYTYDEAGNRTSRQYIVTMMAQEEMTSAVRSAIERGESESIESLDESLVHIYPNPTSDFINVELNQKSGVNHVVVLDMMGRQLSSQDIVGSFGQVDMSTLTEGSYILVLRSGNKAITRKVIKK